jgi:hypothetical protein
MTVFQGQLLLIVLNLGLTENIVHVVSKFIMTFRGVVCFYHVIHRERISTLLYIVSARPELGLMKSKREGP